MAFTRACEENDLSINEIKKVKLGDQSLLLIRLEDGYYATATHCTHVFAPLARGSVTDGCRLVCPFHRAEFNIKTGEVEKWANFPPGIAQLTNLLRKEKALKTYPVKIEEGAVMVDPQG